MNNYELNLEAPSRGCYLSHNQIRLLSIIQCNSEEELQKFINDFIPSFTGKIDFSNPYKSEQSKKAVFDAFVHSFVSVEEQERDGFSVIAKQLELAGIALSDIEEIRGQCTQIDEVGNIKLNKNNALIAIKQVVTERYPDNDFDELVKTSYFSRISDYENIKSVSISQDINGTTSAIDRSITYEEIVELNKQLKDFDLILISSGKFIDTVFSQTQVDISSFDEARFRQELCDFSAVKFDLDFAKRNNKHVRYHSLLTQDTLPRMQGKNREEILQWIKLYMGTSIDFISTYNEENKLNDGTNVISSIDAFNELVGLMQPPYDNIWSKIGITLEELCDVLASIQKPDGVKYLYNETFVETPFKDEQGTYQYKHQAIYENLRIMMEKYSGLIDSFGTQVHIDAFIEPEHLETTFSVLANWQKEFGLGMQITEFDVHIPPQIIDKASELIRNGEKTESEVLSMMKAKKMGLVNATQNAVVQSGIELEGTSYWTLLDKIDPHLALALKQYISEGKPVENLLKYTLFGGKYPLENDRRERPHNEEIKSNRNIRSLMNTGDKADPRD